VTVIPLGRALLCGSSDLPEGCDAPSRHVPAAAVRACSTDASQSRNYCGAKAPLRAARPDPSLSKKRSLRMTSFHSGSGVPSYLVLLRVGFALPAALLRRRCALTAPFHPYPAHSRKVPKNWAPGCPTSRRSCETWDSRNLTRMGGAVYFLWHFPSTGLESGVPDVIRHTALRSSDFPPRK
jgi:hypothetical protein